jgi:hypothetical protein
MPVVPFDSLPDDARVWVFGSDVPVAGGSAERLLGEVDEFLGRWSAHGAPLTCARQWLDDRFLVIAVDQRDAHASGCSIDGLFRRLQAIQPEIGASLLGGGRVFYRDGKGAVHQTDRAGLRTRTTGGDVTKDTTVFDVTVTTLGDWRRGFEKPARETWVAPLLPSQG